MAEDNYISWDYITRLVRDLEKRETLSKALVKKRDDIEAYLDGPNETFSQKKYLKMKTEFVQLWHRQYEQLRLRKAA